ncbi:MAG: hypothetical protein WC889_17080 [Myxococcota bacterium]|jgi:hypothetical protein
MKALHASCPNCGAARLLDSHRRVTDCDFCGVRLAVEIEGENPRFWLKPGVVRERAKLEILRALKDPLMPSDMWKSTRLLSVELMFVPFNRVSARKIGLMTVNKLAEQDGEQYPGQLMMEAPEKDSKVILSCFNTSAPATELPGWGLEDIDIEKALEDPETVVETLRAAELQKMGEVFEVTKTPESLVRDSVRVVGTRELSVDVKIVPFDTAVYFYPVWLVRYSYRGAAYRATVDGMGGGILRMRAPQSNRHRIPLMLAILAVLSWPVSRFTHYALEKQEASSAIAGLGATMYFMTLAWPFTVAVLSVIMFVLYLSWMNYRYPGEVVITPSGKQVEKLGRPAQTLFEKIFERLDDMMENQLRSARRRFNRWE